MPEFAAPSSLIVADLHCAPHRQPGDDAGAVDHVGRNEVGGRAIDNGGRFGEAQLVRLALAAEGNPSPLVVVGVVDQAVDRDAAAADLLAALQHDDARMEPRYLPLDGQEGELDVAL